MCCDELPEIKIAESADSGVNPGPGFKKVSYPGGNRDGNREILDPREALPPCNVDARVTDFKPTLGVEKIG